MTTIPDVVWAHVLPATWIFVLQFEIDIFRSVIPWSLMKSELLTFGLIDAPVPAADCSVTSPVRLISVKFTVP